MKFFIFHFLVAAKNASKKAKKDVEVEEEEVYTPSTDSGGEDDTSEEEEEVEENPEVVEKIDGATVKRNADGTKKRLDDFFIFFSKVFQYMLYYVKNWYFKHLQYCDKLSFFRSYVRKTKEVLPGTSKVIPPPKKVKPKKRDRPNTFMTMENFKEGNQVILTPAKKYKKIVPLQVFIADQRAVNFMYNRYYHNNEWITSPAVFFSNYWQADPATIKNPVDDNGKRETNAKFKPEEVPYIRDTMQLIMDTNPEIYQNMTVEQMPAIEFLKRVEHVPNTVETPAEYVHID